MISRVFCYNALLRILVYVLPLLAFGLAFYAERSRGGLPPLAAGADSHYLIFLAFTEFVWILSSNYHKLSSVSHLFLEHTGIRAASLACLATFCFQAVLLLFVDRLMISRPFIVFGNAILFFSIVAVRMFFRLTAASSNWPRKTQRVLIVGTDHYARRSVKLLRRIPFLRCEIQAYLQLPGQPVVVDDALVINAEQSLDLEGMSFDEVVVATPARRYLQVSPVLDTLQDFGKPVRAILDLGPRLSISEKLFQVGRLQMMNLAISPVESFAYTALKRIFDLVFATAGLIILSPVLAAIALLIKATSDGPILFKQERVGRHGKHFTLFKFRTMRCSSISESDTAWTTKNDSRCTALGSLLRRFSLDELPQLFNVIMGQMSLVGPRPERPFFVAKFRTNLQKYDRRHCCQVGMTGWAQVNGLRGDTSISDRLQHDLYYIQNWSLALDLRIIARTMFVVLKDQNGY